MQDWAALGALAASVTALLGLLTLWSRYSDRLTKVEGTAENALQESAEAKNDNDNLRGEVADLRRDHGDIIGRQNRDHGEGLAAIRQHVTELAFFVRDNFVKQSDFASAMKEIKDSQARMEKKLDEVKERLPRRHGPASEP